VRRVGLDFPAVARELGRLLADPALGRRCKEVAGWFAPDHWLETTCRAVAGLAAG
jgi:hypothetical protein